MLARAGTLPVERSPPVQEGLRGIQPEAGQPRRRAVRALGTVDQAEGSHKLEIEVETPNGEAKISSIVQRRTLHAHDEAGLQ